MAQVRSCTFGMLFRSGWDLFKANYGVCLGFGLLYLLLFIVLVALQFIIGLTLTADASDTMTGHLAVILVSIFFASVLLGPIMCRLLFRILSRDRGDGVPARPHRYGMLVGIALIGQVIMAPAMIGQALGDPDQYLEMRNLPTYMEQTYALQMKKQQANIADSNGDAKQAAAYRQEADELQASIEQTTSEMETYRANRSPMWQVFSGIYSIVAGILLMIWLPWAGMAILDPREQVSSVQEALGRGWQLASSARGAIIGVYIVLMLIIVASICALVLPIIFLGLPFATAIIPGVYRCLRGEVGEGTAEPATQ